jgi:hypothetical protein
MLDDMHREDLVGTAVLESGKVAQVRQHIGRVAGTAFGHVHIDIAVEDLVAATEIQACGHIALQPKRLPLCHFREGLCRRRLVGRPRRD